MYRKLRCALTLGIAVLCSSLGAAESPEGEQLKSLEGKRLRALVDADVTAARGLHADDFQLINPAGVAITKDQYLGGIASGQIDYLVWEPEGEIAVPVHGNSGAVRYRARLEIVVQGQRNPMRRYWHTDVYEKRDGRWQVIWSQATEIEQ